jgi:hypothetical protein
VESSLRRAGKFHTSICGGGSPLVIIARVATLNQSPAGLTG